MNAEKPIAIHDKPGSFSDGWIAYCEENGIPFIRVNCYDDNIISQLKGVRALMWHWHHADPAATSFARQLTLSLERVGVPVFPSSRTAWHFDDKLGQKYLFETLEVPHVPSFAFYERKKALNFVKFHGFPLVFKLARGAGSMNVSLIENENEARRVISRSFGRGWSGRSRTHAIKESFWHFRRDRSLSSFLGIGKGIIRLVIPNDATRSSGLELGYAYFQEFIPNNDSDIRVIVIGGKAFAIRRYVREGDFRASGSGVIEYDPKYIPDECIRIAFDTTSKIGSQVAALDFVLNGQDPLVVEVSYGFSSSAYLKCNGYWDEELEWHEGAIFPEYLMMREFLTELNGEES